MLNQLLVCTVIYTPSYSTAVVFFYHYEDFVTVDLS